MELIVPLRQIQRLKSVHYNHLPILGAEGSVCSLLKERQNCAAKL